MDLYDENSLINFLLNLLSDGIGLEIVVQQPDSIACYHAARLLSIEEWELRKLLNWLLESINDAKQQWRNQAQFVQASSPTMCVKVSDNLFCLEMHGFLLNKQKPQCRIYSISPFASLRQQSAFVYAAPDIFEWNLQDNQSSSWLQELERIWRNSKSI